MLSSNSVYVGLSIFLAIIIIYFFWLYFVFRYSPERIGGKLSNIYTNNNVNPQTQYIKHTNQGVSTDKSRAFATMSITDMLSGIIVSSEIFTVKNRPDCTSLDTNCVNL